MWAQAQSRRSPHRQPCPVIQYCDCILSLVIEPVARRGGTIEGKRAEVEAIIN